MSLISDTHKLICIYGWMSLYNLPLLARCIEIPNLFGKTVTSCDYFVIKDLTKSAVLNNDTLVDFILVLLMLLLS